MQRKKEDREKVKQCLRATSLVSEAKNNEKVKRGGRGIARMDNCYGFDEYRRIGGSTRILTCEPIL